MRRSREPHAHSSLLTRRSVLQGIAAAGSVYALVSCGWNTRETAIARFRNDPFALGVASGYPLPNAVVLWTRLAPEPLVPDGGLPPSIIPVTWEIAEDEHFRKGVRKGVTHAEPAWAHSVHVEVHGLQPGREYWYRFIAGDARSTAGRTRTAPAPGMPVDRVRMAVASCQQYEHGYYTAYQQMVRDNPDLIIHVGDYIYEQSWGKDEVRSHGTGECLSLADYRARHTLYRTDPDLARAHATAPWLVTWDDHDVDNDYAGAVSEHGDPPEVFLARRAAAYQAFYEHLPLPARAAPVAAGMRLYTSRSYGDLVNIFMLDGRQYRSERPCAAQGLQRRKRSRAEWCDDFDDPGRTMLGTEQEKWLAAGLRQSRARWNVLGQAIVMTYMTEEERPARVHWIDGWGGYPVAQARFARDLHESRVQNPVVLSGDIHAFVAADLHLQPDDASSPRIAGELVTTSITSEPPPESLLESLRRYNPNVRFATGLSRGYVRVDVSPAQLRGDLVAMDTITERTSGSRVLASFVQQPGAPGLERA